MNCEEAINYIHSLERFGIMPGLERITALCEALGNLQNDVKFVHIAGTNGKGSTSTMIANALHCAGYKTGLYTSPYVIDFRERIQLDGEMIAENDLAFCVQRVKDVYEKDFLPKGLKITEFEAVTAAAFLCFSKMKCDYVVLEVGLGGRFDATNVISSPEAVCLAYIGLDHTAILGDTIEKIAGEKCGIIKNNTRVVSYPLQRKEAFAVIEKTCNERNCSLTVPDMNRFEITESGLTGTEVKYKELTYKLKMAGEHIAYNSLVAVECCKALNLSDNDIVNGLEMTVMPARMELMREEPVVILDGGHNEDCASALYKFVTEHRENRKIIMVSSIMADKDYDSYFKLVAPLADCFIATKANVPRALESKKLKADAEKYCGECFEIESPAEAVEFALKKADKDNLIIVCGSFYLAGEIREQLKIK